MKSPNRQATTFAVLLCWLSGFSGSTAVQADQEIAPSSVITKTVRAVGYEVGGGSTKVDLKGTELMPRANGVAKVEAKSRPEDERRGRVERHAAAVQLGAEFLTYVLWVVTPEGAPVILERFSSPRMERAN